MGHFLYLDLALAACPAGNTSSCVALLALPIRATAWLCARRRRAACAHTPCMASGRSNAAPATPWLKSISKSITPACACVSSPSQNLQRPQIYNARFAGVYSPLHVINARFAGVISPSHVINARVCGRLFPLAIYGEGVADRPGVRSHGLGCEVQIEKKSLPKKNFLTPPTTTRISCPRRRDETSPWHDENRKEESDREI